MFVFTCWKLINFYILICSTQVYTNKINLFKRKAGNFQTKRNLLSVHCTFNQMKRRIYFNHGSLRGLWHTRFFIEANVYEVSLKDRMQLQFGNLVNFFNHINLPEGCKLKNFQKEKVAIQRGVRIPLDENFNLFLLNVCNSQKIIQCQVSVSTSLIINFAKT